MAQPEGQSQSQQISSIAELAKHQGKMVGYALFDWKNFVSAVVGEVNADGGIDLYTVKETYPEGVDGVRRRGVDEIVLVRDSSFTDPLTFGYPLRIRTLTEEEQKEAAGKPVSHDYKPPVEKQ